MSIERIREALAAGPTPGPWKIRAERYRFIHVYATGGGICHLDTVDGEGAANAKLITAASPENIAAIIAHVEAQAAEIERLRAENDELRRQLAEAEQDAERYRWLRGGANIPSESTRWARWEVRYWDGRHWNTLFAEALDTSIDAAMGLTRPAEES